MRSEEISEHIETARNKQNGLKDLLNSSKRPESGSQGRTDLVNDIMALGKRIQTLKDQRKQAIILEVAEEAQNKKYHQVYQKINKERIETSDYVTVDKNKIELNGQIVALEEEISLMAPLDPSADNFIEHNRKMNNLKSRRIIAKKKLANLNSGGPILGE